MILGNEGHRYQWTGDWARVPRGVVVDSRDNVYLFNQSKDALCVDSRGDIYVAEWISNGRATKLVRQR